MSKHRLGPEESASGAPIVGRVQRDHTASRQCDRCLKRYCVDCHPQIEEEDCRPDSPAVLAKYPPAKSAAG